MVTKFAAFLKLDIRVGRITQVEDFLEAKKKAYKLKIAFGSVGIKNSSAQITKLYSKEELKGKLVIAVVNFPPKQIADFVSEVLVLGAVLDDGGVVLLCPDKGVPIGTKIA